MKLSELTAAEKIRDAINNSGLVSIPAFTAQDVPTSDWPDAYITVTLNGTVNRMTTSSDLFEANVIVGVYIRLLSTAPLMPQGRPPSCRSWTRLSKFREPS